MVVELISVGTELLLGNIVNTNAAYLAEKCADLGLSCYYQSVVGDNEKRLTEALENALGRSDVVILGGGLGPTKDDLTKEIAARVMGCELVEDAHSRECIEDYFKAREIEMTENNRKQALAPAGAIIIDNHNGTAPGYIIAKDGKHVLLLPGPPNELIPMFEQDMYPYLDALEPGTIFSKTVKICGIGESAAETMISDLIANQSNPTIATYAKTGEVHLRVTAKAEDEKEARKLVKPMIKELKTRFGNHIYTTDDDVTLEKAVVELLQTNHLTVATAESCTGGLVAARLINVPGASEVFKAGHITYSNKAKRKIIGVKRSSLEKNGAVSEVVAKEMAKGTALLTKSDVAVSVTGIAGPDGGTKEKPVGLVYIGCYVCGTTIVKECHFSGNRNKIRETSVAMALSMMRECILKYCSDVMFGKQDK